MALSKGKKRKGYASLAIPLTMMALGLTLYYSSLNQESSVSVRLGLLGLFMTMTGMLIIYLLAMMLIFSRIVRR